METKHHSLNKYWIKEKIKGEVKNYLKTNENATYQNLWDAVLKGKFISTPDYLKKLRKISKNQPNPYLKELEKEEKVKQKVSRQKRN